MQRSFSKRSSIGAGILLLSVFLFNSSAWAESLTIGCVDIDKIREGYKKYQEALSSLKEVKDKEQASLDEMSSEFEKNVRRYELKEGLFTSEDEKKTEQEELKKKWNMLNEYKMGRDQDLDKKTRDQLGPMIDKIKATIKDVAQANGYHMVFKLSDLFYCDPRLDFTDKVLNALNKE